MKFFRLDTDTSSGQTQLLAQQFDLPLNLEDRQLLIEIKSCAISSAHSSEILKKLLGEKSVYQSYEISGVVKQTGPLVKLFKISDEVVGLIPLDHPSTGLADQIILDEFQVTNKPNINFIDSVSFLNEAVQAYIGLHYLGQLKQADKVLVLNGPSAFGIIAIQLAQYWGAHVFTTCNNDADRQFLKKFANKLEAVINLDQLVTNNKNNQNRQQISSFISAVLKETDGLGVDLILDCRACEIDVENREDLSLHDLISSLSVGGKLVVNQHDLQLDPPLSALLFMRSASIGFLFHHSWALSSNQQGKILAIITDFLAKLESKLIKLPECEPASLKYLVENCHEVDCSKKIVVTIKD